MMLDGRFRPALTVGLISILFSLPASLLGQTCPAPAGQTCQGTLSTIGASGVPGSTATIPVRITLDAGLTIDSLTFGVQIAPNPNASGTPPALTTVPSLSFTQDPGLPSPTLVDASGRADSISVGWLSGLAISGTASIGTVNLTIPAGASAGQTYVIKVTGASAASGGSTNVNLALGANTILSVTDPSAPKKRRGQLTSE